MINGGGPMATPWSANQAAGLASTGSRTRREFEMSVGCGVDGSVNHWRAVYERVGEFGPLLSGCGAERVRFGLRVCGAGLKQRARPVVVGAS